MSGEMLVICFWSDVKTTPFSSIIFFLLLDDVGFWLRDNKEDSMYNNSPSLSTPTTEFQHGRYLNPEDLRQ